MVDSKESVQANYLSILETYHSITRRITDGLHVPDSEFKGLSLRVEEILKLIEDPIQKSNLEGPISKMIEQRLGYGPNLKENYQTDL